MKSPGTRRVQMNSTSVRYASGSTAPQAMTTLNSTWPGTRCSTQSGGSPREVSLLHALFELKANPPDDHPDTYLYNGAAGQIPPLLSNQLGDKVKLNSKVVAIERGNDGVTVSTGAGLYRGRAVIVAIPPFLTAAISYTPELPAQRLQLVQRMPMGTIAKIACIYPKSWWREDKERLSGTAMGTAEMTVQCTADSGPPGGQPGILTSFIRGDKLIDWSKKEKKEREQAVIDDLVKYFGRNASDLLVDYVPQIWPAEQLTGGAYNAYLPPGGWTFYGPALREPCGRIFWAGTETATKWSRLLRRRCQRRQERGRSGHEVPVTEKDGS